MPQPAVPHALQTKGGTIKIKGFVSGGSAQQSGKLKEGDELVRVDGRAVTEMTVAQATDLIMNGFQAPHSSAAATPIKPVGQMTPPQGAKKHSGKPCGIGLTILDNPPHIVTYITPDGPAARSHAIEVGDTLVAINKEVCLRIHLVVIVCTRCRPRAHAACDMPHMFETLLLCPSLLPLSSPPPRPPPSHIPPWFISLSLCVYS